MSLSQDNDMEGFSSRRAIGIEKESKRQRGFYHATASAGSRGGPAEKRKTDGVQADRRRFRGPWHWGKQMFAPVRSRKPYRVAPTNSE